MGVFYFSFSLSWNTKKANLRARKFHFPKYKNFLLFSERPFLIGSHMQLLDSNVNENGGEIMLYFPEEPWKAAKSWFPFYWKIFVGINLH